MAGLIKRGNGAKLKRSRRVLRSGKVLRKPAEIRMCPCLVCHASEFVEAHHEPPKSEGGRRLIPLCNSCHRRRHQHGMTAVEFWRGREDALRGWGVSLR